MKYVCLNAFDIYYFRYSKPKWVRALGLTIQKSIYLSLLKREPKVAYTVLVPTMLIEVIWILPFGFILAVNFASGIAILIAGLAVIIRDVQIIVPNILSPWFWVTPIIWQVERVPEKRLWVSHLTPTAIVIEAYCSALLGTIHPFDMMFVLAGCYIIVLASCLGQQLFSVLRSSFADKL